MSTVESPTRWTPFDSVAARYDEVFTTSQIGQAQRRSVWKDLKEAFVAGDRVLDLGCGTGEDACFLAERDVRVVACDSSSQMIIAAERKVSDRMVSGRVDLRLLALEQVAALQTEGTFDGAFSNFGALNCVQDLDSLARNLASMLRPGAKLLLGLMGPCCLWEIVWHLTQGNPGKAFRRLRRDGVPGRLAEGATVRTHYPTVRHLVRIFAPEFHLKSWKGIGVLVPPSYVESWVNRIPRLLQLSERADAVLGNVPGLRKFGDHVLLKFEREAR
jgi:SAM-dependent methyltransferase